MKHTLENSHQSYPHQGAWLFGDRVDLQLRGFGVSLV
jgi:hypothetical protein